MLLAASCRLLLLPARRLAARNMYAATVRDGAAAAAGDRCTFAASAAAACAAASSHDDGAGLQDGLLDVLVGQYDGPVEVHLVLRRRNSQGPQHVAAWRTNARQPAAAPATQGLPTVPDPLRALPARGLVSAVGAPLAGPTLMNTSSPITALFSIRAQLPTARGERGWASAVWPGSGGRAGRHGAAVQPGSVDGQGRVLLRPTRVSCCCVRPHMVHACKVADQNLTAGTTALHPRVSATQRRD